MVTKKALNKLHLPLWLVILLAITFILRIPSFFEPFSYGDEMIYLTLGEAVKRGLTLYRDIHDNKPPILYFLAALSGNVFWFRAILAAWMAATTVLFWKLTQKVFPKEKRLHKVATVSFAILTTIPLLEGQIANAELFLIGPTVAAFIILFKEKASEKELFLAGILFSVATLFKVPAAFDILVIPFIWILAVKSNKDLTGFLKNLFILSLGFLIPILWTVIWYSLKGALPDYIRAAFLENLGYLSSWKRAGASEPFLLRNLPLLARGLILILGFIILYLSQKKLSKSFIFTSAWLLTSLFAVTLSERPYPHYLIQAVPAISLLVGILIAQKTIEQSLAIIPLFLAMLVPVAYNFWHYPTLPYYQRFLKLATGQISKQDYFNAFDGNVTRNYKISEFVVSSSGPKDTIFVWGDSPPIYALSRRLPPFKYVANYHINDFSSKEEVLAMLSAKSPRFVIILPQSPALPGLIPFLYSNYLEISNIEGAEVWLHVKPVVLNAIR